MSYTETSEERKAREEAAAEWRRSLGFDPHEIRLGGDSALAILAGGINKALLCARCFCLVPIADLTDATTTLERHSALPHPEVTP